MKFKTELLEGEMKAGAEISLKVDQVLLQIWGVRLAGRLPEWVSAKDVILEMLRRHGVLRMHAAVRLFDDLQ